MGGRLELGIGQLGIFISNGRPIGVLFDATANMEGIVDQPSESVMSGGPRHMRTMLLPRNNATLRLRSHIERELQLA